MLTIMGCGLAARHIVYWPGGKESYVCSHHLGVTLDYGKDKGFLLVTRRIDPKIIHDCLLAKLKRSLTTVKRNRAPTSGVLNVKGRKRVRA